MNRPGILPGIFGKAVVVRYVRGGRGAQVKAGSRIAGAGSGRRTALVAGSIRIECKGS